LPQGPGVWCARPTKPEPCGRFPRRPRSMTRGCPAGAWTESGTCLRCNSRCGRAKRAFRCCSGFRWVSPWSRATRRRFSGGTRKGPAMTKLRRRCGCLRRRVRNCWGTLRRCLPDRLSVRPGGGQRTVEDIVRHVATVEWWYMSRIVLFPWPRDGEYPEDLEGLLAWTRHRVADRLRRLSDEERSRVSVPDPESGERWSARKVLRRLIYHELYHLRQLRRALPV